jgi:hypothetical protein
MEVLKKNHRKNKTAGKYAYLSYYRHILMYRAETRTWTMAGSGSRDEIFYKV